tara:strand:+ start:53 stop:370 length:318 start_codon:yes stop_codon:yes gene_type:complete
MYKIEDIQPGKSYGCKFKVTTMLDIHGRPNGLSDTPLKGPGEYEGFGVIQVRDSNSQLVEVYDTKARKTFRVGFDSIWDIDDVEYVEEPTAEKGYPSYDAVNSKD